jgi:hypothetical protein
MGERRNVKDFKPFGVETMNPFSQSISRRRR